MRSKKNKTKRKKKKEREPKNHLAKLVVARQIDYNNIYYQ